MPLLEADHVCKTCGAFSLEDISFTLEPGYIMGVIGANGCGKTTLIKTILNMYRPDSGEIRLEGRPMGRMEKQNKDIIGFVLEENMFAGGMGALTNARIYGRLYSGWREESFRRYCEAFEIPLKKRLECLSAGIQRRFQIAFALSHEARLLVMDEPAAGLDPSFRAVLNDMMQEFVSDGTKSIFFTTHQLEELEQIGDYYMMLANGRIRFCMSGEELADGFLVLQGEEKAIWELSGENVLEKEYGRFSASALVRDDGRTRYAGFRSRRPGLSEVMYFFVKGGERNDQTHT